MTPTLKISRDLSLPLDFVTKTAGILAQRRKGKTYTASVIAEELVAAKVPFVVLDPTGAWWGLRASADGQKAGLPVVILGGQHGDVPLERTGGKFVAELVVDEPGHYVIDFSLFESGDAERQFATDFAERLYRRKGQPNSDFALHLIVDEADRFAPQRPPPGDQRMLGAFEAIVRRGGLRGLGTTLITQRAAVINKNVLEQVDLLIVLRVVGPNDRDAIERYVKAHGTDEERKALMDSLSSLDLGEAWVWEPGADPPLFERIRVRQRHTFNSSATPKAGEKRVEPRRLADVDLDAIKEAMADTIERAKADDPKELRRRIAQLEKELKQRPAETKVEEKIVAVEMPVITDEQVARLEAAMGAYVEGAQTVQGVVDGLADAMWKVRDAREDIHRERSASDRARAVAGRPRSDRAPERADSSQRRQPRRAAVPETEAADLPAGEAKILTAIAQHVGGVTKEQLTVLTGYKRSSRDTYLQRLRAREYVEMNGGTIVATDDGVAALGDGFEPLPTGAALREHWLTTLPEGERRILAELVAVYPDGLSREDLSEITGYKRSSRDTYVQRLRARQLVVTEASGVFASETLFA